MDFTPCVLGFQIEPDLTPAGPAQLLDPLGYEVNHVFKQFEPDFLRRDGKPWVFSVYRPPNILIVPLRVRTYVEKIEVVSDSIHGADAIKDFSLFLDGTFFQDLTHTPSVSVINIGDFISDFTIIVNSIQGKTFIRDTGVINAVHVFGLPYPEVQIQTSRMHKKSLIHADSPSYVDFTSCEEGTISYLHPGYVGHIYVLPHYVAGSGSVIIPEEQTCCKSFSFSKNFNNPDFTEVFNPSNILSDKYCFMYDVTLTNEGDTDLTCNLILNSHVIQSDTVHPGQTIIYPDVLVKNILFTIKGVGSLIVKGFEIGS